MADGARSSGTLEGRAQDTPQMGENGTGSRAQTLRDKRSTWRFLRSELDAALNAATNDYVDAKRRA